MPGSDSQMTFTIDMLEASQASAGPWVLFHGIPKYPLVPCFHLDMSCEHLSRALRSSKCFFKEQGGWTEAALQASLTGLL